jgi:diguanylate cyclase (GGDEF)-like protein
MKRNAFTEKVESFGLIIISSGVAFIYLRIESLQLSGTSTMWITFSLFIGYGIFTQYFINSYRRMAAEIASLSITDSLTGLHNRRGFLSLAEQQLKLSNRTKRRLLLFFADLDGLKYINDTLGHEEGDQALIDVASVFKETFRSSDIIARMGGDEFSILTDEFAILTVDTEGNAPEIIIKRLQDRIDSHNNSTNRKYKLSISIGCSFYDPENPSSIDELMAKADKMMYEKKQKKKSRPVC